MTIRWAKFGCPKCGYETEQPASATVSHQCKTAQTEVVLKKLVASG